MVVCILSSTNCCRRERISPPIAWGNTHQYTNKQSNSLTIMSMFWFKKKKTLHKTPCIIFVFIIYLHLFHRTIQFDLKKSAHVGFLWNHVYVLIQTVLAQLLPVLHKNTSSYKNIKKGSISSTTNPTFLKILSLLILMSNRFVVILQTPYCTFLINSEWTNNQQSIWTDHDWLICITTQLHQKMTNLRQRDTYRIHALIFILILTRSHF